MGSVGCPLCCKQEFISVVALHDHLLYYVYRPLQCSICSIHVGGIQEFTHHLERHLADSVSADSVADDQQYKHGKNIPKPVDNYDQSLIHGKEMSPASHHSRLKMHEVCKVSGWGSSEQNLNCLSPNAEEEPIELTLRAFFCQTCGAKVVGKDNYFFHIKQHLAKKSSDHPPATASISADLSRENSSQGNNKGNYEHATFTNATSSLLADAETITSEENWEATESVDAQLSDCMEEENVTNQLLMLREWQLGKHGRTFRKHCQSLFRSPKQSTRSPACEKLCNDSLTSMKLDSVEIHPSSEASTSAFIDQELSDNETLSTNSPCLSGKRERAGVLDGISPYSHSSYAPSVTKTTPDVDTDDILPGSFSATEEIPLDSSIVSNVDNDIGKSLSTSSDILTSFDEQPLMNVAPSDGNSIITYSKLGILADQCLQNVDLENNPTNSQLIEDTSHNVNDPTENTSGPGAFSPKVCSFSKSDAKSSQGLMECTLTTEQKSTLVDATCPSTVVHNQCSNWDASQATQNFNLTENERIYDSEAVSTPSELEPPSDSTDDVSNSHLLHEAQKCDFHISENDVQVKQRLELRTNSETLSLDRHMSDSKPYLHKKFHHDQERKVSPISKSADVSRYIQSYQSLLVSKLNGTLSAHVKSETLCLDITKPTGETTQYPTPLVLPETSSANYDCEVCDSKYSCRSDYVTHYKTHEIKGQKNFTCQYCNKKFYRKHNKDLHIRKHTGEKAHKCPLCSRLFTKLYTFMRHKAEIHSKKKPYVCTVCSKEFSSQRQLKNHLDVHQDHKNHKCNHCDHACQTASGLRTHKLEVHSGSEKKQYNCDICNQSFMKLSGLKRHTQRKHSTQQLQCDLCSKVYSCNEDLSQHRKTHDTDPIKCDQCGKAFTSSWNLQRHSVVHKSTSHPYHCEKCTATFTRLDSLKNHLKLHTQKKSYICHCGKRFVKKSQLKVHEDKHSSIPKYKCNFCNRAFKFKVSLKNHSCKFTGNVTEENPETTSI